MADWDKCFPADVGPRLILYLKVQFTINDDCNVLSLQALHKTAKQMKDKFPSVFVESSGGVTENNIEQFMSPHVDVVSSSITTQGYSVVDFSLKIEKDGHNPENPLVNIGST